MSTYVISDIHGCYNEFLALLEKICFSGSDTLILAGDYIDRGKQSYEMLKWIEQCPSNILLLRGNLSLCKRGKLPVRRIVTWNDNCRTYADHSYGDSDFKPVEGLLGSNYFQRPFILQKTN